jgi:hypothetical protein
MRKSQTIDSIEREAAEAEAMRERVNDKVDELLLWIDQFAYNNCAFPNFWRLTIDAFYKWHNWGDGADELLTTDIRQNYIHLINARWISKSRGKIIDEIAKIGAQSHFWLGIRDAVVEYLRVAWVNSGEPANREALIDSINTVIREAAELEIEEGY